ncbi:50S ribosomal protein L13 [Candidatus Westeberhardia cardiocondylae]|uniref:Large ribosomal subunit protein uL13 n=1 Tax=Candidatus Westeberhardia cardiocondylae TaxID=1594731 RepID=A0A0H5BWE5_9ENTR|nr:50S ribosomal protein L13 [Candidatus Westeberhardia cardiocondylae]MCR3756354.1 50S ribosomal subunit protein L13 [Candidatus Westeberhardia cardiocondylae]CEN31997.1 50S ribosomal protein L13 [Candidatus Westeberhardia cardiocondylae]
MKTFSIKSNNIKRNWYYVDATGKTLGRLSSKLAHYLRGKHKVEYTPHIDTGDYLIVLNAKKIYISGKKRKNKIYFYHTGYVGGIKKRTFQEMITKNPKKIIEIAVKGMLPRGVLGRIMFKKLKIYENNKHAHKAQKPKLINFT